MSYLPRHKLIPSVFAALLFCFPTAAQEVASPNELALKLSEEISSSAVKLGVQVEDIRLRLQTLPADLDGAEQIFDEMIEKVGAVLVEYGPDSEIATGVDGLANIAKDFREEWRTKCESTQVSADCARVELWNVKVIEALEVQGNFQRVVGSIEKTIEQLEQQREYIVDDIRLALYESALEQVRNAVADMEGIQANLTSLSVDIGPQPETN